MDSVKSFQCQVQQSVVVDCKWKRLASISNSDLAGISTDLFFRVCKTSKNASQHWLCYKYFLGFFLWWVLNMDFWWYHVLCCFIDFYLVNKNILFFEAQRSSLLASYFLCLLICAIHFEKLKVLKLLQLASCFSAWSILPQSKHSYFTWMLILWKKEVIQEASCLQKQILSGLVNLLSFGAFFMWEKHRRS